MLCSDVVSVMYCYILTLYFLVHVTFWLHLHYSVGSMRAGPFCLAQLHTQGQAWGLAHRDSMTSELYGIYGIYLELTRTGPLYIRYFLHLAYSRKWMARPPTAPGRSGQLRRGRQDALIKASGHRMIWQYSLLLKDCFSAFLSTHPLLDKYTRFHAQTATKNFHAQLENYCTIRQDFCQTLLSIVYILKMTCISKSRKWLWY